MSSFAKQVARKSSVLLSAALVATGLMAAPAQAVAEQGSATGTLYVAEISSNTIWVGDIGNPPGDKTAFWTGANSGPDQVATTLTSVAWSSSAPGAGSALDNKLLIAPIARTAANIVEVSLPGDVKSLAADIGNDRILASVNNTIVSVKTDGTDLRTIVTDNNLEGYGSEWAHFWSLAIDEIDHKIYASGEDSDGVAIIAEYTMDASNLVEQSRRVVYSGVDAVNGLFVDPISKILYWTRFEGDAVCKGTVDGLNQETILASAGNYPTGAVISNATGKFYFTTEDFVYEMNLDGTGLRQLYAGEYTGSGFEGLAVAFGVTLDPAPTYDVTYDANVPSGKTASGSVPTGGEYNEGDTVDVQPNSNGLAVAGYSFAGWNTEADGSGLEFKRWSDQLEDYITSFSITEDTTLYAQWAKLTVTKSGQNLNVKVTGSQPSSYRYVLITDGTNSALQWLDYSNRKSTVTLGLGQTIDGEGDITFACDVEYTFTYVDWTNWDDSVSEADAKTSVTLSVPCASEAKSKTIVKRVFFAPGSAKLRPAAVAALKDLAKQIKALGSVTSIKVLGYVQPSASKANDSSLSRARALAVQKALKQYGVTAKITISGKGRLDANSWKSRKAEITVKGTVAND